MTGVFGEERIVRGLNATGDSFYSSQGMFAADCLPADTSVVLPCSPMPVSFLFLSALLNRAY